MATGLLGLFDDIAALAKLAATSIDDVGVAAAKASTKAAGIVVDDAAVTPGYVRGLAAERELPIIRKIAKGSLKNKLVFILPAAILLSIILPIAVEIILLCGGVYLAYEGTHKIFHLKHKNKQEKEKDVRETLSVNENKVVKDAVRTDLILSAEIMVIALKDVLDQGLVARVAILAIVAVLITVAVYGAVALLVKADDLGLRLSESQRPTTQSVGRSIVRSMPKIMAALTYIGMAAMLWVGGHIVIVGVAELGWHTPENIAHTVYDTLAQISAVGGVLGWIADTLLSTIVGFAIGATATVVLSTTKRFRKNSIYPIGKLGG